MTTTTPQVLRITRLIKAPRERVFAAWTNPAELMRWFGPPGCQTLSAKIDLKVGGEYRVHVKNEKFGELDLYGVYREIKPPSRLVFTWNWKGTPAMEFGETPVAVDFVDKQGATELQLAHERLPNAEQIENHRHGWSGCLDKLETYFAGVSERMTPGNFSWNELVAPDVTAAGRFYSALFGWETAKFPSSDVDYILFKKQGREVGGLMKCPKEGMPAQWISYVTVENADSTARKAGDLGAKLCVEPRDIPDVGRIAVFEDPQGAAVGIFQPVRR